MEYALSNSYIQRIYQTSVLLKVQNTVGGNVKYNARLIYQWAQKKFSALQLPDRLCTTSRKKGGQSVNVIYDGRKHYFCILAEHPDTKVAGRTWSTEAELIAQEENVRFGVKLSCSTSTSSDAEPAPYSIPRFARRIIINDGTAGNFSLGKGAIGLKDEIDLELLKEFLEDPLRTCPIVVVAENGKRDEEYSSDSYLVDPDLLARQVSVTAFVFRLPLILQDKWEELVDDDWRVMNGCVRTYYPGLNLEYSESREHPFSSRNTILASSYTDYTRDPVKEYMMGEAYAYILRDRLQQYNSRQRYDWKGLGHKFYYVANREQIFDRINGKTENVDELKKAIYNLQATVEYNENEALTAMQTAEDLSNQLDEAHNIQFRLNNRIAYLESRLIQAGDTKAVEIPIPDTYDKLSEWVEEYFSGKIKMMSRAKHSLKDAQFSDVGLVYKSLKLLGTEYYQMRHGLISRADFKDACDKLGVTESSSISDVSAGEVKEKYTIIYRGKPQKIDRHIKNNTSARDPLKVMRIYFFWDDDDEKVVICSLPQHLPNRMS